MQPEKIYDEKNALRAAMREVRAEAKRKNPLAGQQARDLFCRNVNTSAFCIVGVYKSIGSEMDSEPLIQALQDIGCILVLPVVIEQELIFRRYVPGDRLTRSSYGTHEPLTGQPELQPDLVVVPFLAFDAELYRLGYGGGFYDRTLRKLRQEKQIQAIGIGFACQQVPRVPHHDQDVRLDKIITEAQLFKI